jgi:hypothetical protein
MFDATMKDDDVSLFPHAGFAASWVKAGGSLQVTFQHSSFESQKQML